MPQTTEKYRQIVGDLRYLADCTRPDITYVTGKLGAAMHAPTLALVGTQGNRPVYTSKTTHWPIISGWPETTAGTSAHAMLYWLKLSR